MHKKEEAAVSSFFYVPTGVRNHNPPLEVPETVAPLPNTGCIAVRCLLHFSKTPALPASDPGSIPRSSSLPSELLPTLLIIYKATLDKKQGMVNDITFA